MRRKDKPHPKKKKKVKKLKGNRLIHQKVKQIENEHYLNNSLNPLSKIKRIIVNLKELQETYRGNSIIGHSIVKWNDKLKRIES